MVYYLLTGNGELAAMNQMRRIEKLIMLSALVLLFGNGLTMMPVWYLTGSIVCLGGIMLMIAGIAAYTGWDRIRERNEI